VANRNAGLRGTSVNQKSSANMPFSGRASRALWHATLTKLSFGAVKIEREASLKCFLGLYLSILRSHSIVQGVRGLKSLLMLALFRSVFDGKNPLFAALKYPGGSLVPLIPLNQFLTPCTVYSTRSSFSRICIILCLSGPCKVHQGSQCHVCAKPSSEVVSQA
jgi:hypothetical protein